MSVVIESLRQQIATYEAALKDLRRQLEEAERAHQHQERVLRTRKPIMTDPLGHDMNFGVSDAFRSEVFAILDYDAETPEQGGLEHGGKYPLEKNEYSRYGRQLIMPEIGLQGECPFAST